MVRFWVSKKWLSAMAALFIMLAGFSVQAADADPTALLQAAFDNWRGKSSEATITLVVHRPEWERTLTMKSWTEGNDKTLARFTAPAKDAGNATLKQGSKTFVYNPKLNQVVKLPASLLSQSWMGSDFSYNDLVKADDLLTQYTHKTIGTERDGGHTIYTIEAMPKPGAPVVWGKLEAKVRDDGIMMEQTYFDQDMQVVRVMKTERIAPIGGRDYPVVLTMHPRDKPEQWTKVKTISATFNTEIPAYIFTRSNLQNPRGQ
jgi:outer membrane lipoprotein-sorting protein